jgi:hypothetical protein
MAERQKNLLGKSRNIQKPYAIWKGQGPFGNTEMCLIKTYQVPANEAKNQYAKWMVAVKSDMTHGSYDMGDTYITDAIRGLRLTYADPLFKQQYWDSDLIVCLDPINNLGPKGE